MEAAFRSGGLQALARVDLLLLGPDSTHKGHQAARNFHFLGQIQGRSISCPEIGAKRKPRKSFAHKALRSRGDWI